MNRGGYIPGEYRVSIERVGTCESGHDLYRIGGGPAEHIISAADIRVGDYSKAECPNVVADDLPDDDLPALVFVAFVSVVVAAAFLLAALSGVPFGGL